MKQLIFNTSPVVLYIGIYFGQTDTKPGPLAIGLLPMSAPQKPNCHVRADVSFQAATGAGPGSKSPVIRRGRRVGSKTTAPVLRRRCCRYCSKSSDFGSKSHQSSRDRRVGSQTTAPLCSKSIVVIVSSLTRILFMQI